MPAAKQTTDHDFIRRWTEERKGSPATVKSTHRAGETGVLRIDFKGVNDKDDRNLQHIPWDEFFEKFEEAGLAFLFQEKTADGSPSRFFKLVKRDAASSSRRATSTARSTKTTTKRATPPRKEAPTAAAKTTARGGAKAGAKSGPATRTAKRASAGR